MGNKSLKTCSITSEFLENSSQINTIVFVENSSLNLFVIKLSDDEKLILDYDKKEMVYDKNGSEIRKCKNVKMFKTFNFLQEEFPVFTINKSGFFSVYYIKFNKLYIYDNLLNSNEIECLTYDSLFRNSSVVFSKQFEIDASNVVYSSIVK